MGVDGRHRLISILGFSCQGYICGFSHQKNIFGIYVKTYFWDLRQKYYFNLGWEFRTALSLVKAFISVDLHHLIEINLPCLVERVLSDLAVVAMVASFAIMDRFAPATAEREDLYVPLSTA